MLRFSLFIYSFAFSTKLLILLATLSMQKNASKIQLQNVIENIFTIQKEWCRHFCFWNNIIYSRFLLIKRYFYVVEWSAASSVFWHESAWSWLSSRRISCQINLVISQREHHFRPIETKSFVADSFYHTLMLSLFQSGSSNFTIRAYGKQ